MNNQSENNEIEKSIIDCQNLASIFISKIEEEDIHPSDVKLDIGFDSNFLVWAIWVSYLYVDDRIRHLGTMSYAKPSLTEELKVRLIKLLE